MEEPKESKLPLLVETIDFPHRPARKVILSFEKYKIRAKVINKKTGNVLISGDVAYHDGPKTIETLTREVIEKAREDTLNFAIFRYDNRYANRALDLIDISMDIAERTIEFVKSLNPVTSFKHAYNDGMNDLEKIFGIEKISVIVDYIQEAEKTRHPIYK